MSSATTVLRKWEQSVNQRGGSGGSGQLCGNLTHLEKLLCTNTDQPSSPLGFLFVATSLTHCTMVELIARHCIRCRINNSHKGSNKSYQSIANAFCSQQLTSHDAEWFKECLSSYLRPEVQQQVPYKCDVCPDGWFYFVLGFLDLKCEHSQKWNGSL